LFWDECPLPHQRDYGYRNVKIVFRVDRQRRIIPEGNRLWCK
jgi:hypothetical protein